MVRDKNALEKIKTCDLGIAIKCNYKCKMCYFWKSKQSDHALMDIQNWKDFIDQLDEVFDEKPQLIFSGPGEVLLREGIEDLLQYTAGRFRVFVNSNGAKIDDSMAKLLGQTADEVFLSLDGVRAQTHDSIRGVSGAYEAVVNAAGRLRKESKDMIIMINTVIMQENLDELTKLVKWVDAENLDGVIFHAVSMPFDISYDRDWYKHEYSHLWPSDPKKVDLVLEELIQLKSQGSRIVTSIKQLNCFKSYFMNPEEKIEGLHCEVDSVLKIDSDGDVRICNFSNPVGNVKEHPLLDLLVSPEASNERRKAYECNSSCHLLVNSFKEEVM
ncbi:MAG: radical SAM protein [Candidatus Omnitrophota bacterium]